MCFTTSHCQRSCVERHFIMVKCKFEKEINSDLSCDSPAHGVSNKVLCKNKNFQSYRDRSKTYYQYETQLGENPEINIWVMHDPGGTIAVRSQSLVGEHKVPVVLRERAEIILGYDGLEGKVAGSVNTFACILSLADYYTECFTSGNNTHEGTGKATAEARSRSLPHNGTH